MPRIWRKRIQATGWIISSLLCHWLITRLFMLHFLQDTPSPPVPPRRPVTIALFLPPPPPRPIAPRHTPGPPRPVPSPRPSPPHSKAPASPAPAATAAGKPPALLAALSPQESAPQAATEGLIIGGGSGDGNGRGSGGGGDCGKAAPYLALNLRTSIASQLQDLFTRSGKTGNRRFKVKARIWFDDSGAVKQATLVETTRDNDLDAAVTNLLGELKVGANISPCIQQPVTVWVSQPTTSSAAESLGTDDDAPKATVTWQTREPPR